MKPNRNPKGSEGGDLQIRNLDADTLNDLQELKQYYRVGTNSKAALFAIRDFLKYKNEIQSLRLQLQEAKQTINDQSQLLRQIGNVIDTFRRSKTEYDYV